MADRALRAFLCEKLLTFKQVLIGSEQSLFGLRQLKLYSRTMLIVNAYYPVTVI